MSRPNILLIIADQLAWKALPAYGDTYVKTPNIDRIAGQAALLSRCYTPCPLCQPARAAFWTGRWPHQTGVLSNGKNDPVVPIAPEAPTLGSLASAAGYRAVHFGKTHDAGGLRGFEVAAGGVEEVEPAHAAWPINQDTTRDRYTARQAVEFLREPGVDPFLAVVDLNNPHNICGWVGDNQGPHSDVPTGRELPLLPDNFDDENFTDRPLPVQYICCTHNRLAQAEGWNEENYRYYLAAYYHYIERMDEEVGRVLDALDQSGRADDTLVVFMGDHGDGMAAHRMVTKQVCFFEEVTRVPFMVRGPGIAPGMRQTPLASLLDLLPTLCDYAEAEVPEGLWGCSLRPWLEGRQDGSPHAYVVSQWHTEWGFTVEPGRMLRTQRYKYTRYLEGDGEELYDLEADPGEHRTLVGDGAYAGVLADHRRLLEEYMATTADPFETLAWRTDPRWRQHTPGYQHHKGPSAPMVG